MLVKQTPRRADHKPKAPAAAKCYNPPANVRSWRCTGAATPAAPQRDAPDSVGKPARSIRFAR